MFSTVVRNGGGIWKKCFLNNKIVFKINQFRRRKKFGLTRISPGTGGSRNATVLKTNVKNWDKNKIYFSLSFFRTFKTLQNSAFPFENMGLNFNWCNVRCQQFRSGNVRHRSIDHRSCSKFGWYSLHSSPEKEQQQCSPPSDSQIYHTVFWLHCRGQANIFGIETFEDLKRLWISVCLRERCPSLHPSNSKAAFVSPAFRVEEIWIQQTKAVPVPHPMFRIPDAVSGNSSHPGFHIPAQLCTQISKRRREVLRNE